MFATVVRVSAKLDASVGASGPHDFAVRVSAIRQRRRRVHRIPRPTSVTIAKRPSEEAGPNRHIPVSTPPSSENSENQKSAREPLLRNGGDSGRISDRNMTRSMKGPIRPMLEIMLRARAAPFFRRCWIGREPSNRLFSLASSSRRKRTPTRYPFSSSTTRLAEHSSRAST